MALFSASACGQGQEPILLPATTSSTTGGTIVVEDGPLEPPASGMTDDATGADTTGADATGADTADADTTTTEPERTDPRPLVIYDTDMGPDVDDVLALAMLHGYQDQGRIELAAVTVSRNSEAGARYSDAVNTFFGHPDIPVGIFRADPSGFDDAGLFVSKATSWPHTLGRGGLPDGYKVQRQVLARAEAEGRDVMIIQTGFSGNTAQLLRSDGDEHSPRPGTELVADTVSLLSVMAGSIDFNMVEFNIERDIDSARYLFANWPGRLVMSPFELGNSIHYPYSSITSDYGWTDRHPVREAYEFRDLDWHQDAPPYYNMKSWDLTSVMYAVEPEANWFYVSGAGMVTVDESGKTTFTPGSGRHYVLDRHNQYSDQQRRAIIDRMIELSSAQPS